MNLKKKILTYILSFLLVFCTLPLTAFAADVSQSLPEVKTAIIESSSALTAPTNYSLCAYAERIGTSLPSVSYKAGVSGFETTQVESLSNKAGTIFYTYDANGNIETITEGRKEIKYYYDELNEVTKEDNQVLDKTITYAYDAGGNITKKSEYAYKNDSPESETKVYNYSYEDTNWKDKLISYDEKV